MPTDDYHIPPDALPPVPEIPDHRTGLTTSTAARLHLDNGHFRYCRSRTMDLSDSDRPVSFSSTSSSVSSRDSHCSFGSRTTLVSNNHLGLCNHEKETGAIKLELSPTRQFSNNEQHRKNNSEKRSSIVIAEKRQSTLKRADSNGSNKICTVSPAIEPASPKLLYVDRVVHEILETERTYVHDLKSIVQDYLDCITDQSRPSLGMEERLALFGNIRDIYHFNSELLQDLENCDNDPVAIAECFVAKNEEFHIYTQYCTNYPRSVAVLTECMRNKVLAKFFRERQEALKHSLPLGSYLLKPVQRILKYHLLLHEIANHLDKDTEGYDVVLDAIDTMQRVAWHINDMKRKHEHAVRLQEIQSLLTNWKGLDLTSYGELVLEGTFRIQRAKNERTLFLFDKLLLITKKREETYTYKAHILCCNLILVEVIPKEPLSFSVFHYKNPKLQHTVQAKSQQDKRLWILHLKRLILENHPAKIPAKAKQAILEMNGIHHPGFHYSPEGERKTLSSSKEGTTPRRIRRKSELIPEFQKRINMEGTLLSTKLGSSEAILSSNNRDHVLDHSNLVNQSQESLEPAYPSDLDDSHLQAVEQTDADDEEESEQGVPVNSQPHTKGGRKRLNSQASENVEKRRSINFSLYAFQTPTTSSIDDSCQLNSNPAVSCSVQRPARKVNAQSSSDAINALGGACNIRNIWTDHQIRQALFPSRRGARHNEDDDYQMFLPTVSTSNLNSTELEENSGPSRPCSWHFGFDQQRDHSKTNTRPVRRSNSVGKDHCHAHSSCTNVSQKVGKGQKLKIDMDNKSSLSGSSDNLTVDAIENVYDNISYEDLKLMGLIRKESFEHVPLRCGKTASKDRQTNWASNCCVTGNARSAPFSEASKMLNQNCASVSSYELKIVEESIYDTIGLPEYSDKNFEDYLDSHSKRDSYFGLETDFACCDNMGHFVSQESLHFSEDDASDHRVPGEKDCLVWVDSSSNSDSLSHKSVADKLSEEVDEIWNDLENYIKKNEEQKRDRLPAAFPVNKDDLLVKAHNSSAPELNKEMESSMSTLSLPENPGLNKAVKNKHARLSGGSIKSDEEEPQKDRSLLNLSRTSFSSEVPFMESSQTSTSSVVSHEGTESTEQGLDIIDKTKNRVFTMARQYSQKIKKANQLLKMKNPDQEQPPERLQKQKHKDLAAILEEKKQGGPAIGARIAEYSQLYDQILFRDSPSKMQKDVRSNTSEVAAHCSPSFWSASAHSQSDSQCLSSEDWLLHSTYSNGELADFVAWPDIQDLKSKYSTPEGKINSTQRKMVPACSVPSLMTIPQLHTPMQRWSTIISQPNKENFKQEHIYNSLERTTTNGKPHNYNRSQFSSTDMVNRSMESIDYTNQASKHIFGSSISSEQDQNLFAHLSNQRGQPVPDRNSEMILQDSQKILVVNRDSPLSAQTATQNYFANFKDTDDDDDDDDNDYVEIKSEDEDECVAIEMSRNYSRNLENKFPVISSPSVNNFCDKIMSQSPGKPGYPIKELNSKLPPLPCLTAFDETDKLNDYLWRVPSPSQQNIVQSLREKFQCLSSSSFA
ncbi:pleckstrin homology domain-containing family G member 1 isoform X2 [Latimeria chalumnae]|uniref:pleckstrin homology domain-containing family G member 1 isoform X2 n=1 Tax=Latimeria chalumnae TaxID=7897 RepID=UPI00313C3BC1